MCAKTLRSQTLAEDCNHADAEPYGFDANGGTARCTMCGKTLASPAVESWVMPLSRTPMISLR